MPLDREYFDKVRRIRNGEKIEGECLRCKGPGQERIEGGLLCGCWCEKCFTDMVYECRSKSW